MLGWRFPYAFHCRSRSNAPGDAGIGAGSGASRTRSAGATGAGSFRHILQHLREPRFRPRRRAAPLVFVFGRQTGVRGCPYQGPDVCDGPLGGGAE